MQKKTRFSSWGLTPQVFLFFILPLTVLLILVTFGGLALHQRAMRDLVGERDVRAVRAAASALFEQLDHRRIAVRNLAMSADVLAAQDIGLELEALLDRSDFLVPFFDRGLAFFGPNGELLASTDESTLWQAVQALPEFDRLLVPGDQARILTAPQEGVDEQLILFSFAPGQGPVAIGALSSDELIGRTLTDIIQSTESSVAFVTDMDGRLLFRSGEPLEEGDPLSHPGVSQALQGISGATYLPGDGKEHVIAYSPVPLVDWALVIEEPWTAVTNPVLSLTENAPLVLIPVVLLSVVALWFATSRIVQPLKNLEARAARLAWGDFRAIEEPVGGINEIRHLQDELVLMAQKVRSSQQGLRNYIGAITQGQEEERRRLAREIHDDTIQSLIALKQRVQLAELSQDGGTQDQGLEEIEELTDQTIKNLRRITRALRPIYLEDLGLIPALEMLTSEVDKTSPVKVSFKSLGAERRLPPAVELALYRIAQEALSNVIRHAEASKAALHVKFSKPSVELQIRDNGRGFIVPESPADFAPGGHYGLLGLYERAEMIGARLEIQSEPGEGSTILVNLPLENASG